MPSRQAVNVRVSRPRVTPLRPCAAALAPLPALRPPGWSAAVQALLAAQVSHPVPSNGEVFASAAAGLALRPDAPLSLQVAVPFCAAHCLFCERAVEVAQPAEVISAYVENLVAEMAALAGALGSRRELLQLNLGGGTANELSPAQLSHVVEAAAQHWTLPAEAQLSADCDPRQVGWLQLHTLRGLGFRRLAFGALDLDPAVQAAIGRVHSAALVGDVCEMARDAGIESIELKLMVGLPRQSAEGWLATLQRVLAMAPDRISIGRYRHHPQRAPGQYALDADTLPDPLACRGLMALAGRVLCEAGYGWIGADQFVLESDELALARDEGRLRCGPEGYSGWPAMAQLGIGAGAMGEIDGHLLWNDADLPSWRARVRAGRPGVSHAVAAEPAGLQRRAAVERLLCTLQLPQPEPDDPLHGACQRLLARADEGEVELRGGTIHITEAGRCRLPELCGAFAAAEADARA